MAALELVTTTGEIVRAQRGDADFDGMVVALGALGAITRLTLDVEPAYEVRQRVFEDLAWDTLFEHFDAITAAGYSVSVFTAVGRHVERSGSRAATRPSRPSCSAPRRRPSTAIRSPASTRSTAPPSSACPDRGGTGCRTSAWASRPSAGEELQSEFLVPRVHAIPAIEAVRALAPRVQPVLQVTELRTIAADSLWMSPQYGRPTIGIHFTWKREPAAGRGGARPRSRPRSSRSRRGRTGASCSSRSPAHLYERRGDFTALMERLDPRGAFRNAWLDRFLDPGSA